MNADVRRAVFARSKGRCECGCLRAITEEFGHLDHFFGRAKAEETPATCWMLHPLCDNLKTNNNPSAIHWLEKFVVHSAVSAVGDWEGRTPYFEAMDRSMTRLSVLRQKFGAGGTVATR